MRRCLSCLLAAAFGCATKPPDSGQSVPVGGASDCGGAASEVIPGLQIPCDNATCTLEVVSTLPAPPDRGPNEWTLRLFDPTGGEMALDSLEVAPFMPLHAHGTVPPTYAGARTDTGWAIGPFDLFMPGLWELRVDATSTDGAVHTAVVTFCVEG